MFENIIDKLNYEHEKYFCYLKLISRTDFYTKAYEITVKEAIFKALSDELTQQILPKDLEELLFHQENIIDFIYMKAADDAVIWKKELTKDSWSRIKAKIKF